MLWNLNISYLLCSHLLEMLKHPSCKPRASKYLHHASSGLANDTWRGYSRIWVKLQQHTLQGMAAAWESVLVFCRLVQTVLMNMLSQPWTPYVTSIQSRLKLVWICIHTPNLSSVIPLGTNRFTPVASSLFTSSLRSPALVNSQRPDTTALEMNVKTFDCFLVVNLNGS